MSENFSDTLVSMLVEANVKRIYGIVGDSLNPISNALHENGKINFIHVRHEESAAFAASAEAQLSGNISVCAGTAGPGNTHLINGLYDANRSYAPVLAIASDIPSSQEGTGYFQETHPNIVFRDCSKYCAKISNPEQMPRILQIAIQKAISLKGVATIVIPGDLGETSISKESMALKHKMLPSETPIEQRFNKLEEVAEMINSAKKITLFCGAGCKNAENRVIEFAQKISAPIAYTMRGKEFMGIDNPLAVGMTGLIG